MHTAAKERTMSGGILSGGTMDLPAITLALFSFCNFLRVGSYLPQIVRIAMDNEGAKAISYWTWGMWVAANGSTAAYAVVNVTDWVLFAVNLLNTLGCAAVMALTYKKRRQFASAERRIADVPRGAGPIKRSNPSVRSKSPRLSITSKV
jgi:hypothetical protein